MIYECAHADIFLKQSVGEILLLNKPIDLVVLFRLEDFVEWMNGVEDTIAELEKESLSVQEYKDTLAKFEVDHITVSIFVVMFEYCNGGIISYSSLPDVVNL